MKHREKRERSSNESSKWNLNYVKTEKSYRSLSRTYQQKKNLLPTNTNPNRKRENSETQPFPSRIRRFMRRPSPSMSRTCQCISKITFSITNPAMFFCLISGGELDKY